MRLAPVALRWFNHRTRAVEAARTQSRTTHATAAAVEACALLAEILVDTILTGNRECTLRSGRASGLSVSAIAQGSWQGKARDEISSTPYVVHTLEAALWAVDRTDDFRSAVLLAANLGGDAGTVAAVAGQIAGALWGKSAIPKAWLERLAWRETIEERGRQLLAAADVEENHGG